MPDMFGGGPPEKPGEAELTRLDQIVSHYDIDFEEEIARKTVENLLLQIYEILGILGHEEPGNVASFSRRARRAGLLDKIGERVPEGYRKTIRSLGGEEKESLMRVLLKKMLTYERFLEEGDEELLLGKGILYKSDSSALLSPREPGGADVATQLFSGNDHED